jgi:23S rRNA (guanine745-N1)-methyltransferase
MDRSYVCAQGHSFDIARSGYISLLQPQDRKSLEAGDSREAVRARSALVADGVGAPLFDTLRARLARLSCSTEPPVVVELGCGGGELLGYLAQARPLEGIGIDLSTAAASDAARHFPTLTWVVANADRRLPVLDASVDVVLSVHARRNPSECARVLHPSGLLMMAVPAANDLIELRSLVQGEGVARDRTPQLIAEHAPWFTVVEQTTCAQTTELDREALRKLLRGTYRGERLSQSAQVQALDRLTVTIASDVVLFTHRLAGD